MIKYRIESVINWNNEIVFYPQYKHWYNLFWKSFIEDTGEYYIIRVFKTLEEAENYIQRKVDKINKTKK